ncbi:MAG: DUF4440 domain-containing protein [Proteobacteria bacterium SG_bin9]|nr:MAG: DUF4440 domain-containing protein [Proteobacteria bacterium SG_bin9]
MSQAAAAQAAGTRELEILHDLNRNYLRAVEEADVKWFDENLSDDFLNSNPDGSIVDRAGFLAQIGKGSTVKNIVGSDIRIRLLGDFAFIHARTDYVKLADGTKGFGRYTDIWWNRGGRWLCVSAHVTRG